MKERLVELFYLANKKFDDVECTGKEALELLADHLIDNGVIVPPCKVGDTVYIDPESWGVDCLLMRYKPIFVHSKYYLVGEVVSIIKTRKQNLVKLSVYNISTFTPEYKRYPISAIGKTVFFTRERAQAKLKEGVQG